MTTDGPCPPSEDPDSEEGVSHDEQATRATAQYLPLGIGLGVALGSGIGVAIDNVGLGVGIGMALGSTAAAIGLALTARSAGPASRDD